MTLGPSWIHLYCHINLLSCLLQGSVKWPFYTAYLFVLSQAPIYSNPISSLSSLDEETFGQKEKTFHTGSSWVSSFLYPQILRPYFPMTWPYMHDINMQIYCVLRNNNFIIQLFASFSHHLPLGKEHEASHSLFSQSTAENLLDYLWENYQACCVHSSRWGISIDIVGKFKTCQSARIYHFHFFVQGWFCCRKLKTLWWESKKIACLIQDLFEWGFFWPNFMATFALSQTCHTSWQATLNKSMHSTHTHTKRHIRSTIFTFPQNASQGIFLSSCKFFKIGLRAFMFKYDIHLLNRHFH